MAEKKKKEVKKESKKKEENILPLNDQPGYSGVEVKDE